MNFEIRTATEKDSWLAPFIVQEINDAAKLRLTGVTSRTPEYVADKIKEGKALLVFAPDGDWVAFCYLEVWTHQKYVANSGLFVRPAYRGKGLCGLLKTTSFELARNLYPNAKIFSLTSNFRVMEFNAELGFTKVSLEELQEDKDFWNGYSTVVNYPGLIHAHHEHSSCSTMVFDPQKQKQKRSLKKTA